MSRNVKPTNSRTGWVAAGIFFAVVLIFGQTLGHEFVNIDDDKYVVDNTQVAAGLTVPGITWAFADSHSYNWHPLTWISHMIDCQIFGLSPWGHHLTNLLLHAFTAILLFLLLTRMTGAFWRSALVATFFAIHPLRVESVAWIAERKDVLSGLFFVVTLWAYHRYTKGPSLRSYFLVVGCFILGLLSKPMLVTLPFVLLLLDYWPLERSEPPGRLILEKIPLLFLNLLSCVVTYWAQTKALTSETAFPFIWRLANAVISYVRYLGMFFFPTNLAPLYPYHLADLELWKILGAIFLLTALTGVSLWQRQKRRYLLVGWLWYLGMMVPVIGIVHVGGAALADRYTYLPQIGFIILLVWSAGDFLSKKQCQILSTFFIFFFTALAVHQVGYWKNSESLWVHTLACTSDNALAENNYGVELRRKGRDEEALVHFQRALELRPNSQEAIRNVIEGLRKQGKMEEAEKYVERNVKNAPDWESYHNAVVLLLQQGRKEEAEKFLKKTLVQYPQSAELHGDLAQVLEIRGKLEEAIVDYRKAITLDPRTAGPHNNLALLYERQGKTSEAISEYVEALRVEPNSVEAHNNLGLTLARQGKLDEAIAQFRWVIRVHPGTEAFANLGRALAAVGQAEEAKKNYEKALELDPKNGFARDSLETLSRNTSLRQ